MEMHRTHTRGIESLAEEFSRLCGFPNGQVLPIIDIPTTPRIDASNNPILDLHGLRDCFPNTLFPHDTLSAMKYKKMDTKDLLASLTENESDTSSKMTALEAE